MANAWIHIFGIIGINSKEKTRLQRELNLGPFNLVSNVLPLSYVAFVIIRGRNMITQLNAWEHIKTGSTGVKLWLNFVVKYL